MMVTTTHGATRGTDGISASLSGPSDRKLLLETRRLSDAILIGAETLRAEKYQPVTVRKEWHEARHALELEKAPRVVVVSGGLDLPWELPIFSQSAYPVTVVTSESINAASKEHASRFARIISLGFGRVDLEQLITWMRNEGLHRIVCEGGEKLVTGLLKSNSVDEIDLTISPAHTSPEGFEADLPHVIRCVTKQQRGFELIHKISDGNFHFCRYIRSDQEDEAR